MRLILLCVLAMTVLVGAQDRVDKPDTRLEALEAQIKNLQNTIQTLIKQQQQPPPLPLVEADRRTKEDGARRCRAIGGRLGSITFPGTTAAPSSITCRF